MGSKKPKMEVTEYYMSIHFGICTGPLDEIQQIVIDKKEAWRGNVSAASNIGINKQNLFGGLKKEGGVSGTVAYLPGDEAQVMPAGLASRMRLTPETCPAYRGMASAFFYGAGGGGGGFLGGFLGAMGGSGGFYWRANSPYLPGTWIKVKRVPKGLDLLTADIDGNANGAHIIWECLTNTDWGMGAPAYAIDRQSFLTAAQTLYDERFGIALLWTQQETIENFITNVVNHVEGVVYVDPSTGLITFKLIRADYDPDDLFEVTPDNANMSKFQRKLWGETVNEIVVSWTNPENEETETVTIQDLANIAMQGGIVSQPKDYKGIRNADLAMRTAARDLRVASSPLASCEVQIDRSAWKIVPGEVIAVTWPENGMRRVAMRVGNVDYGRTSDPQIRVQLVEDVFSLPQASYVSPPPTGWIDPSENPTPLVWSLVFTLPYFLSNDDTGSAEETSAAYPHVSAGILGAHPGSDTAEFVLMHQVSDPSGASRWEEGSTISTVQRGRLDAPLTFETVSSVAIKDLSQGYSAAVGSFVIIGDTDETMEMCVMRDAEGDIATLVRGVLDTVPREWPAGTPVWFVGTDSVIEDGEPRIGGQLVEYYPLTVTSRGRLSIDDALPINGTLTERPWLPSRPANVKINGMSHGQVDAVDAPQITVTWANRNRLMEDSVVLRWDEATVVPEEGQTTTVSIHDIDGNLITSHDGLTGTSFVIPAASFGDNAIADVRVTSMRGDLVSLQGHTIRVKVGVPETLSPPSGFSVSSGAFKAPIRLKVK